jgi:hypothetical protein
MIDLTAIDILVEPDQTALARAGAENERMRAQYLEGFALDDRHRPHITLLQRYVRTKDLDAVFDAVETVIRAREVSKLGFRATRLGHMPVAALPGHGLAAIVVTPGPEVFDLQSALIEAVMPFAEPGGTASAFATTPDEPEINADTLNYVERYVTDHSGPNFIAHLTVGLAPLDFLVANEAAPFDAFTFHPAGIAVFKLGNNGTAQEIMKSWNAS